MLYKIQMILIMKTSISNNHIPRLSYFKERKRLKTLQKAQAYLEPMRASTMKLFVNILNG